MNKYFNENVVEFLKEEEEQLRKRIAECNENGDYSMYPKFITAYEKVVELIKKYDWELIFNEYSIGQEKYVAVWEQNGDGLTKNYKTWNVK